MLAYANNGDLDNLAALFGVERLPSELDDAFRIRTQLAFEGISVAGPVNAYRFHALTGTRTYQVDDDVFTESVKDALVFSPTPGTVQVFILNDAGETDPVYAWQWGEAEDDFALRITGLKNDDKLPSDELIAVVDAILNQETVRPLNDIVDVQKAVIVNYDLEVTMDVESGPDLSVVMGNILTSLNTFFKSQHTLGKPISDSALMAAIHLVGVVDVELSSPSDDVVINPGQVAYVQNITITVNK